MKKFFKTISLLICFFVIGEVSFGQPGNLFYHITGWTDAALTDRGVTSAVTINPLSSTLMSFLFNTTAGNYNPKWCGSTTDTSRSINQKISGAAFYYTYGGWDHNMSCAVQANYYYTLIVGKNSAANNDMSIVETSYNPVNISTVAQVPASNVPSGQTVNIFVTLSSAKNTNEKVFVRYTTDNWVTSAFIEVSTFDASFQGMVAIPGQPTGTTVSYYALTSNQSVPDAATIDYFTLRMNNNSNLNYSYSVSGVNDITWCNLQWPPADTITVGGTYNVYAQVYKQGITDTTGQGAGIQAWIGYSVTNTNPATWTNWVAATYNSDIFNNDEYKADIGSLLPVGTFYYASRFQLNSGSYFYGGFTSGFWDGITNVSGKLLVNDVNINWCNLQWPAGDTVLTGDSVIVYSRVYAQGITDTIGQGAGIQAWIGYDTANTNPITWTNWIPATFNTDVGNDDEYTAYIGSAFQPGKFYYTSRFQLGSGSYYYGGFSSGFWDGTTNVSGELTVSSIAWCNLQSPATATINMGDPLNVYARVYAQGITDVSGQGSGIHAWIGYSTTNTHPDTWTNWIPAAYNVDVANNDEYKLNIGNYLPVGTFYFASRFQPGSGPYFYGGFNTGFWDGTTNVSGMITVICNSTGITWCNVHSPGSGNIIIGDSIDVFTQVFAPCITEAAGQGAGVQAWIGYDSTNTDPQTWTNWITADYYADISVYDEYKAAIGGLLPAGTYYYASRFLLDTTYYYGGFSSGFWDGITNVSGILSIIDTSIHSGIEETATARLDVFPNPASDFLTVKLDMMNGEVLLRVFNILGGMVLTDAIKCAGITQRTYDISDLPEGIYILEATIHNSTYTKKMVIY